jgi:hypothetical protein
MRYLLIQMEVVQGCHKLLKVLTGRLFSHPFILGNQVHQISILGQLQNNIQIFFVLNHFVQPGDIGMLNRLEHFQLVKRFRKDTQLIEDLDSDLLPTPDVRAHPDSAILPFPKRLPQQVQGLDCLVGRLLRSQGQIQLIHMFELTHVELECLLDFRT